MKTLHTLTIQFDNRISSEEIPFLRGAFIRATERSSSQLLFHNHQGDKFRYAYPLIQYKRLNGCAAVVCVNEGIDAFEGLMGGSDHLFQLGGREVEMKIASIAPHKIEDIYADRMMLYRITGWLPLNSANYQKFKELEYATERISFLENILVGNILSFYKGVGVFSERTIQCKIVSVSDPLIEIYKGVEVMVFEVDFKCDVHLPPHIGIGKGVSIGYGTVVLK